MKIIRETSAAAVLLLAVAMLASGCATVKNRKGQAPTPADQQISELQAQLEEKDRRIQELEQIAAAQAAPAQQIVPAAPKSGVIRVPGVTVEQVQTALKRAGIDPGPVDGRAGRKTKEAIKEFQRRKNLKADGIVGKKTWALLQ